MTTTKAAPVSAGHARKNASNASSPPADAPKPTTGNLPTGGSDRRSSTTTGGKLKATANPRQPRTRTVRFHCLHILRPTYFPLRSRIGFREREWYSLRTRFRTRMPTLQNTEPTASALLSTTSAVAPFPQKNASEDSESTLRRPRRTPCASLPAIALIGCALVPRLLRVGNQRAIPLDAIPVL